MKPSDHEKLLRAILSEDDSGDFQQASLEHGLTCLRRKRRRRYAVTSGALVAVLCLVVLEFLEWSRSARRVSLNPQPSSTPQASAASSKVKFISDQELLALFPNRPVALIGKPGEQRLVFLDQNHSPPAPSSY